MALTAQRIGMLIGPGYEDLEYWVVYMRMIEEGATVLRIGLTAGESYSSKHGCLVAESDAAASEVGADDVDSILIPGGWAPDKLRRSQSVTGLVHDVYAQGKIVGLICHAGLVGISAGIVRGKRATGSLGIKDDLVNAGAQWVDAPAFRDGNLVWGRVVEDIPHYCRELVAALKQGSQRGSIDPGGRSDPNGSFQIENRVSRDLHAIDVVRAEELAAAR